MQLGKLFERFTKMFAINIRVILEVEIVKIAELQMTPSESQLKTCFPNFAPLYTYFVKTAYAQLPFFPFVPSWKMSGRGKASVGDLQR